MTNKIIILAALAALTTSLSGSIIYEGFDYTLGQTVLDPDGGLNGGNGLPATNIGGDPAGTSTGLRNQWNIGTVVSGLTYTGLTTSGNALQLTASNDVGGANNAYVYRGMTTDPFSSVRVGDSSFGNFGGDGDTLYFSFLMQSNSATERAGLILYGGATSRYEIGVDFDGSGHIGVTGNNGPEGSEISYVANQTFLMVGQIDFTAGNDTLSLWVNPTLGGSLGSADIVDTTVAFDGLLGLSGRYGSNTTIIDEFRLGTTIDSVMVPEPSTYALFAGLLCIGGVIIRRRLG